MGVELPLLVVVTILECCVTFSGVKLSIRSFVLFWRVKSYICVEFGPMRTHKEVFRRAFGIADPNGLCLVNFGSYFLSEFFHHV